MLRNPTALDPFADEASHYGISELGVTLKRQDADMLVDFVALSTQFTLVAPFVKLDEALVGSPDR